MAGLAFAHRGLFLLCISALLLTYGDARPLDISSLFPDGGLSRGLPAPSDATGPGRHLLATCVNRIGNSCPSSNPYPACCSGGTCLAYKRDSTCPGTFGCASSSATEACCPDFDYYSFCPVTPSNTHCYAPGDGGSVTCGTGFYDTKSYVGCCDPNIGICGDNIFYSTCRVTCSSGVYDTPSCCNKYNSVYPCTTTPSPPVITPSPPVTTPSPPVATPAPPVAIPSPPVLTPSPPVLTPSPPVVTPSPPVVTPSPPVVTPSPPVVTPSPPVVTPSPPVVTPSPPTATPTPPFGTPPPVVPVADSNDKGSSIGIIAGAVGGVGAAFAAIAALALCCIMKRNKRKREEFAAGKLPGADGDPKDAGYSFAGPTPVPMPKYGAPSSGGPFSTGNSTESRQATPLQGVTSRTFSYEELMQVTNGFNAANIIGQGGFSKVYQGTLADGTLAAVKVMRADQISGPDNNAFLSEMAVMSRLRHKNLLSMLGYATAGTERIIVLELCRGGNLHDALHGPYKLDWNKRLRTALDVTIGLEYLHEGVEPPIFHRDVKSANVLFVDETRSVAKLSDFGVAKYEEGVQSTRVLGTQGYVAPEYVQSGQVTKASDVYSHGVLLAELITGRPCLFQNGTEVVTLRNWIVENKHQPLALVDPALGQNFHPQQAIGLIQLAVECLNHERPKARPTMPQIHRRIEEIINVGAAPAAGSRPPYGASTALSTTDFNTFNIPVAPVVGAGPPTGSSFTSGDSHGPYSGGASSGSDSFKGGRNGPSNPASSELNMTMLQPFTNIIKGR